MNYNTLNVLSLAYIGDAIYEADTSFYEDQTDSFSSIY